MGCHEPSDQNKDCQTTLNLPENRLGLGKATPNLKSLPFFLSKQPPFLLFYCSRCPPSTQDASIPPSGPVDAFVHLQLPRLSIRPSLPPRHPDGVLSPGSFCDLIMQLSHKI